MGKTFIATVFLLFQYSILFKQEHGKFKAVFSVSKQEPLQPCLTPLILKRRSFKKWHLQVKIIDNSDCLSS